MVRYRKELANATIRLSKHVPGAETRITLLQTVHTLTKRAENVERLVIWHVVSVDPLELLSPRARAVRREREFGHMSSQCPKKKVRAVEESTTASQAGSQDTIMVGSVGRYFDVGSVSEVILDVRGADEKICSMDAPKVREGESVDMETDSGSEVSCLPVNIGADTYPLHETRLSMCGGHYVAAGGRKLHEFGARILGLEAANVRGDVVNLLVRLRVMNIGKAEPFWLGDGLPCRLWECVPRQESFGDSHHAREETLCVVPESQAQASQRVAVH